MKGGSNGFALKGANAGAGADTSLKTMYDGPRPPGYQPMHKTGAIILGVGGDNVSRKRRAAQPTIPGMRCVRSSARAHARAQAPNHLRRPQPRSIGTFYEGVLTAGYSTDAADDAVQADRLAVGYGQ